MRKILIFSVIFVFLSLLAPSLTNRAIASTILFQDNFDSGNASQWTSVRGDPSLWKVKSVNGSNQYGARIESGSTIIDSVAGDISTSRYQIDLDFTTIEGVDKNIDFRWLNNQQIYEVHFTGANAVFSTTGPNQAGWPKIASNPLQNNQTYHIKIVLDDQHIQFFIDSNKLFDINDPNYIFSSHEKIGLRIGTGVAAPTEVWFDNIVVSSLDNNIDLNVPLLKQTSDPWKSLEYDTAHLWSPTKPTINDWGCAMTSAAMVLKYHGINKLPDGTTLDPGTLNTWLKNQPDGYVGNGLTNWLAISRLSKQATLINSITAFDGLEYTRVASTDASLASSPSAKLTDDISHNLPDILEEPGHFIVTKGINGDTFNINDPYFDRQTLSNGYANTFINAGTYTPSHTDLSYILFIVSQNVNLSFQNSNNQTVGNQFIQQPLNNDVNGNPAGPPTKFLYLPKPENGNYIATLSATSNQIYQFGVYLYDKDGNVKVSTYSGILGPNSKDTFVISFNKNNSTSNSRQTLTFKNIIDDINLLYDIKQITKNDRRNDLVILLQKAGKIVNTKPYKPKELKQKLDDFEKDLIQNRGKYITETAFQNLLYDLQLLRTQYF